MCLVLKALDELRGVSTKVEVLSHIDSRGWIVTIEEDFGRASLSGELKYQNRLAWAKKDALEKGYVFKSGRDCWEITRQGIEAVKRAEGLFSTGEWDIRNCYMFTPLFKLMMNPNYSPSGSDKEHPGLSLERLKCL